MSNIKRAAERIWGYLECQPSCDTAGQDERQRCNDCMETAHNCAADLAEAGLLAPDLPEPAYFESGEVEWDTLDGYVNINDGLITVSYSETNEHDDAPTIARLTPEPGQLKFLDTTAAKDLGTLLTAAAHHTERKTK